MTTVIAIMAMAVEYNAEAVLLKSQDTSAHYILKSMKEKLIMQIPINYSFVK